MDTNRWDPDEIIYPIVMAGYLVSATLVLAGGWHPLACDLLFGHPCDPYSLTVFLLDGFFYVFAWIGGIPAIAIVLFYGRRWLATVPAVFAVLNSLALWLHTWFGSAESERAVAVTTNTLYAVVALTAGALWLSGRGGRQG